MKKTITLVSVVVSIFLTACASKPESMATAYTSPVKYKNYDCEQIALETEEITRRTTNLYVALKKKADDDAAQMGVGLILFWPALFFLEGGDGVEAAEYSRLKGDLEALRSASIQKKCDIDFTETTPEAIAKKIAENKETSGITEENKMPPGLDGMNEWERKSRQ